MAKKAPFITDDAGVIGSHLAEANLRAELEIRILDQVSPQAHSYNGNRPEYLRSDVALVQNKNCLTERMQPSHALLLAHQNVESLAARAFNMGGGTSNTISLIEFIRRVGMLQRCSMKIRRNRWRQGDQRYFDSDIHSSEKRLAGNRWSALKPNSNNLTMAGPEYKTNFDSRRNRDPL